MSTPTREQVITIGLALAEELSNMRIGSYNGLFFAVDRNHPNFKADATHNIQKIAADIINGHAIGNDDSDALVLFDNGVAKRIKIQVSVTP